MGNISGKIYGAKKSQEKYLTLILGILLLLFLVSLFRNISYPLFWADESMTVMGGVRVLEYGYPKVHDGKNVFYDLLHPNPKLGIDEKTDAYIGGASWGQYYFATLGIKLAEMSDDLFTKTAIIRTTFALVGLAGLGILALLGRQFFHTTVSKTGFLALFAFFEVISVPLVLHLREARYYPLTLLSIALAIFVYTRYRILAKMRYSLYVLLLVVFLFLVFFSFSPVYFILFVAFFLFESVLLIKRLLAAFAEKRGETGVSFALKEIFKDHLLSLLPVIISFITVLPLIYFFKIFYIGEEMANFNMLLMKTSREDMYVNNLSIIWRYFASSDFIYLAIFSKICLVFSLLSSTNKDLHFTDALRVKLSTLLTIIFITYFFAMARIPNFLFTRYFIPLQPILALMIILDLAIVYNFAARRRLSARFYAGHILVVISIVFVIFNISRNYDYLKGHLYEMTHQYKGPLDYVIPYIREHYPNPENLVIATNYEETSYMYYLNAKVTVGFVGNNLEDDSKTVPDIIVFRYWHRLFIPVFTNFLQQHNYRRISFSVADYPVNNLPELNWAPPVQHQFRTGETSEELKKVGMYVGSKLRN